MKVLVTGGAGFIGSNLVDAYQQAGHHVAVIDDLSSGKESNLEKARSKDVMFYQTSILQAEEIESIIRDFQPDLINHHAAQISVRHSMERPDYDADLNIKGLIHVLEAARKNNVKKLVFASSGGGIFAETEDLPAREDHAPTPLSAYGVSKLCGEHYLQYYYRQWGIESVSLRYANVYGPRQDPHGEAGVVAIFCLKILDNAPLKIFDDGEQTRDFLFIEDVTAANLIVSERLSGCQVFNLGTAKEISVNSLFRELKSLTGYAQDPEYHPPRKGEQRRSSISHDLFFQKFSWKPRVELREGLEKTFQYFKNRA